VKRSYSEPHWEKKQGAVMAYERVTLYGVPIVTSRKINYGRIEPELARDLFIRHALVEGDWETHHKFFHENRALLAEVEDLEHRTRRRDILVDEDTLFDFYDRRIGAEVISGRHFDGWWKKARHTQPDLLGFEKSMLTNEGSGDISKHDYPDFWRRGDQRLKLSYEFDPGAQTDGVTVDIPLPVLNQTDAADFSWQIPGRRVELITALLRSLPKQYRRQFAPIPDSARDLSDRLTQQSGSLVDALTEEIRRLDGVVIPRDAWDLSRVPDHLRMTYRVVDDAGRLLGEGKDLTALSKRLAPKVQETVSEATHDIERTGLRGWTFGELPEVVEQRRGAFLVTGYPALADAGDSVHIQVFSNAGEAQQAMRAGLRRLILLNVPSPIRFMLGQLSGRAKLALSTNPYGDGAALLDDCVACALDAIVTEVGPPRDSAGFDKVLTVARERLRELSVNVLADVQRILIAAQDIEVRLDSVDGPAAADIRTQLGRLVYRGFVSVTGLDRLADMPRYLQAIIYRLDRLSGNQHRDYELMLRAQAVEQSYQDIVEQGGAQDVADIRWMLEELRVSYFAQTLGTPYPVSDKRIYRAIDDLAA
jgi:ATP-dependent helicase HrpA